MQMSFPFLLRTFSTSIRCHYRTKKIPEDIVANALTTQPRKRGRPKNTQDVQEIKPNAESQSASTSKAVRKPTVRKGNISLPVNRLDLPPLSEWRNYFPTGGMTLKSRISIANPETAALVADSFVPNGSRDKIIIEAYPGEDTDIQTPIPWYLQSSQRSWCVNPCFNAIAEGTNPENYCARGHRTIPQLPERTQGISPHLITLIVFNSRCRKQTLGYKFCQ